MHEDNSTNIADIRRQYMLGGLRSTDLTNDPLMLFSHWLNQACQAKLADPTAMCVATVDANGQPYQRIVLLKHFDEQGMIFYTNLASRKAQHLTHNAKISLHFPWHMLDRQVSITGKVETLSIIEVMKYFHSRPKDSQIAAWASKQSSRISARSVLENQFMAFKQKFSQGEVPLPSFWGGYRVKIETMEFWQGRENRLHDRFLYQRNQTGWQIDRLAP